MQKIIVGLVIVVLTVTLNVASASAQANSRTMVYPGSPEAAGLLQKLKNAEYSDRGNSGSFTSDDPSLGHYYARKAREVQALIERLENGRPLAREEIENALNNDEAQFH